MILASYAIGAHRAFIYARGEFYEGIDKLNAAVAEAKKRNYLGNRIFRIGFFTGDRRASWSRSLHRRRRDGLAQLFGGLPRHPKVKATFPRCVGTLFQADSRQ